MRLPTRNILTTIVVGIAAVALAASAAAQETVEGTPSFKIGATIFSDYTYNDEPTTTDANGDTVHPNAFNVSRAYINVTGNLSRMISFRITPDINRETSSTSSNNGSLVFRLKYAFAQFDLSKALGSGGSWAKLGLQTAPWIDYDEGIYRYRFQGPTFVDAEGYLASSDFGLSGHYSFPSNYGDVHVGVYNGDGYNHTELNDQKSIQIRASLRPAPGVEGVKGLRINGYYDTDHYVDSNKRERYIVGATYESAYLNAGGYYLDAKDQKTAASAETHAKGYTVWANPRTPFGLEALVRYDDLKPDDTLSGRKKRVIGGVAYWFPTFKGVQTAVMLDYTNVRYEASLTNPDEKRWAVHTLINF